MKASQISKTQKSEIPVPRKHDAGDFEVVGIPFKKPGFYVYEVESEKLLEGYARTSEKTEGEGKAFVPTSALVTNLSVHLKFGPENALVWVTQLDKGIPVQDAKVEILDCHGKSLWKGSSNKDGIAMVSLGGLTAAAKETCETKNDKNSSSYLSGLFAFAQKGQDLSFVHSSWKRGLESWRFNSHRYDETSELVTAHTVTDRSIFMPGDTVHMKHFYRKGNSAGFELENSNPWKILQLRHSGSDTSYFSDLKWDSSGSALSDWSIPKKASLGRYEIYLSKTKEDDIWESINLGWFQVEEFKIPLTSGSLSGPKSKISHVDFLDLKAAVRYLAGGSASGLAVKVENRISAAYSLDGPSSYKEFRWNQGPSDSERFERLKTTLQTKQDLSLNDNGESQYRIGNIPKMKTPISVRSEATYKDPSGEFKTLNYYKLIYPSTVQLGVKSHSWIPTDGNIDIQIMALDLDDKILAGQLVNVDIVKRETVSHRKKLVGGVYGYENKTVYKNLGKLCSGKTDAKGLFECKVKTKHSGNLYMELSSTDTKGRLSFTHLSLWVPGEDDWWFGQKATDRMDVIPEKKDYKIGETARFQVKMPYRTAHALVTVEREGVLDASVQNLSGKGPIVEIPVKGNYSPNVHIGVLAVRGRVGDPPPTAIVDLAKPSFKTGQSEIAVGWDRHKLDVSLSTPKKSYKTNETFPLTVKVVAPKGRKLRDVDLAVVAVDEGLFELLNNNSWDLLSSMMRKRNNSVESATAQLQVVGKRHYGLKALPSGGGGSMERASMAKDMAEGEDTNSRKDFSPVILWQGKVKVNSSGEVTIPVQLNDSITAFRLGAIATAEQDLFGSGSEEVQATKDLMVFGGASLLSRHGDQFGLEYTLRNSTAKSMDLELGFEAFVDAQKKPFKFDKRNIILKAGETQTVVFDVKAPHMGSKLKYLLKSTESRAGVLDLLESTQKLISPLQVRTLMSEIKQVSNDKENVLKLQLPVNAYPNVGGAVVNLSTSISPMLAGVRDYMKDYAYNCFEQKTSKLIVAGDEKGFQALLEELPEYLDGNGFLKYFPDMPQGSDVLTAYFLAITHEKGWKVSDELRNKMTKALSLFVEGKVTLSSFFDSSHLSRRKLDAMEALSRFGEAKVEYLNYLDKNPRLWSNSELLSYLNVAQRLKNTELIERTRTLVESRLHEEGTLLQFKDHHDSFAWWYMQNNAQDTLRYWLNLLEFGGEAEKSRIVKLLQASVNMQEKGHWFLTSTNAWGSIAVEKFQKQFESEKVTGETLLKDGSESFSWKPDAKQNEHTFAWKVDKKKSISMQHQGEGQPWVSIQNRAARSLKEKEEFGFQLNKTIQNLTNPAAKEYNKGDLVRISIEVESLTDMGWIVVEDPIPSFSTLLGKGLGGESNFATSSERSDGVWPLYGERRGDRYLAYFEFVPKGKLKLEYTYRLNATGEFILPHTRVEAMYHPSMFAEAPNDLVEVK